MGWARSGRAGLPGPWLGGGSGGWACRRAAASSAARRLLVAFAEELAVQLAAGKGLETTGCISHCLASISMAAIIEAFHRGRTTAWQPEWRGGTLDLCPAMASLCDSDLVHAGNTELSYKELK